MGGSGVRALAAAACLWALACGSNNPAVDGGFGPSGPPVQIGVDGGGGGGGRPDAGTVQDRTNECVPYCNKLFQCGFLPRPGQPQTSEATCVSQCSMLGHFPSDDLRACVREGACVCDGGASCHTVHSCFPTLTDAGF
jgi:hypothetical protein